MIKLALITVLLITLLPKSDDDGKTVFFYTSSTEKLNGHVKQLIEVNTDHIGSFGVKKGPSRIAADFDKKGDIVQIRAAPNQIIKFNTKYDNNGKRISTIGNAPGDKITCIYDNNGRVDRLILNNELDKNSRGMISENKYDGNDDIVEDDVMDSSGKVTFKEIFSYDDRHHLVARDMFLKGKPEVKIQYQNISFDRKGNWIKKIMIWEKEKDTITRKITYY